MTWALLLGALCAGGAVWTVCWVFGEVWHRWTRRLELLSAPVLILWCLSIGLALSARWLFLVGLS